MRKLIVLTFILSLLHILAGHAPVVAADASWYVRIAPADYKATLRELGAHRTLDIAGVNLDHGTIDLVVTEEQYQDLQTHYEVTVLASPTDLLIERPDPQYLDPGEIAQALQTYNAAYPSITRLVSIGQTEEGRTIWALKISDNALFDEDEPVVLFNGQHHAREVMTSEVTMDLIDYLCTRYTTDPVVNNWVNNLEIWVIPMLNLDGVNHVFTSYTLWRKDRHDNNSPLCPGIDPNRNYDAFWGACFGSSGWACMDTYRGAYPAESFCVTHICGLAEQVRPIFEISYHSYSELVIYPYGCDGDYTPDHEAVALVGQTMASLIQRDSGSMGYTPGLGWEILYATDGSDTDWYYAQFGTFAYVIEMNADAQGFQPNYASWRDSTVQRLRASWQYLLNRVHGPGVTGIVRDACTNEPIVGAVVNIQEIPLTPVEMPRITDSYGRFFRVLNSGAYHLQVGALGYPTVTIPIQVGASLLERDVLLVPGGAFGLFWEDSIVHDNSGDQDGVIDPGETVTIEVILRSIGTTDNVNAILTTSDPYVAITTSNAYFGQIPNGETRASQPPHYVVAVNPSCPEQHVVEFTLLLSATQDLCITTANFTETVSSYVYQCPIYHESLNSDPGYQIQNSGTGGWAYGHPTSGPGNGHTGANCYATNLTGNYGNNGAFNLVSTPFNCSTIANCQLKFWRYLRNESGFDTASVEVSSNNVNWTVVWSGYALESAWTEQTLDISSVADGQSQVFIRWRLTSDANTNELGFYVDDISICGDTLPAVTRTPAPTWTPGTGTPSPTFTTTPTRTPALSPSATPSSTTPSPTHNPQTPTNTPTPYLSPTPSPLTPDPTFTPAASVVPTEPPAEFRSRLVLNDSMFEAGEPFLLHIATRNSTDSSLILERYVVLDVFGTYFFHPLWRQDLDYVIMTFTPDYEGSDIILDFVWPLGAGEAEGLVFWLAYLEPGTINLVGEVDTLSFGYR